MFFLMLGIAEIRDFPVLIFAYLVIVGLLAVSTVPTMSIKHLKIAQEWYLVVLLSGTAFLASLVVYTWQTLIAGCAIYLLSVFFSASRYYRQLKRAEAGADDKAPKA